MRGLESSGTSKAGNPYVHHHMRGLETPCFIVINLTTRSPPHAWLRNQAPLYHADFDCSPPHAWLRNLLPVKRRETVGSPPHAWLRKPPQSQGDYWQSSPPHAWLRKSQSGCACSKQTSMLLKTSRSTPIRRLNFS